MPNSKKHEYMYQRSSDNKTPIELAQKNDMRYVVEIAEQITVSRNIYIANKFTCDHLIHFLDANKLHWQKNSN